MTKLKNIIESVESNKYYWMDSDGKLFNVEVHNHNEFAAKYFAAQNKNVTNPREELYKIRWLRVVIVGYMGSTIMTIHGKVGNKISDQQWMTLDQLADTFNVNEIHDYLQNKKYNIDF